MRVRDTGGWWRIVIDWSPKSAKFCVGEGEREAIPTSASTTCVDSVIFWRWLKTDLRLQFLLSFDSSRFSVRDYPEENVFELVSCCVWRALL